MTKAPRPPQFQSAEFHWHAVHGIRRNLPVVRKQAQRRVALLCLIEHLQCFAPGRLLLVVDLTEIEHRPLYGLATRHATVLDDAEIAVVLTVFLAIGSPQKHRSSRMPEIPPGEKGEGLHPASFPDTPVAIQSLPAPPVTQSPASCERQAIGGPVRRHVPGRVIAILI